MPKLYGFWSTVPSSSERNMWATASAMGSIIAAVAVLLIHMETSAVAAITPRSRRLGAGPDPNDDRERDAAVQRPPLDGLPEEEAAP